MQVLFAWLSCSHCQWALPIRWIIYWFTYLFFIYLCVMRINSWNLIFSSELFISTLKTQISIIYRLRALTGVQKTYDRVWNIHKFIYFSQPNETITNNKIFSVNFCTTKHDTIWSWPIICMHIEFSQYRVACTCVSIKGLLLQRGITRGTSTRCLHKVIVLTWKLS